MAGLGRWPRAASAWHQHAPALNSVLASRPLAHGTPPLAQALYDRIREALTAAEREMQAKADEEQQRLAADMMGTPTSGGSSATAGFGGLQQ